MGRRTVGAKQWWWWWWQRCMDSDKESVLKRSPAFSPVSCLGLSADVSWVVELRLPFVPLLAFRIILLGPAPTPRLHLLNKAGWNGKQPRHFIYRSQKWRGSNYTESRQQFPHLISPSICLLALSFSLSPACHAGNFLRSLHWR